MLIVGFDAAEERGLHLILLATAINRESAAVMERLFTGWTRAADLTQLRGQGWTEGR